MKNEEVHIYFLFDNEYLFDLKRNQGLLKLKLIYEREIDLISLCRHYFQSTILKSKSNLQKQK